VIGGSQQLRIFRRAIRDGATTADAAETAGIGMTEARLIVAEDAKNPPPEEAYVLLGHNSEKAMSGNIAADELRLLIERAERLEEEKRGLNDDIKDVFGEAKSRGYDPKIMRKIVAIRRKKRELVEEENTVLSTYCEALGMQYALI
jgi:uncharacterized protein (UPF0335 family)